jgi:hypothetical protein
VAEPGPVDELDGLQPDPVGAASEVLRGPGACLGPAPLAGEPLWSSPLSSTSEQTTSARGSVNATALSLDTCTELIVAAAQARLAASASDPAADPASGATPSPHPV